MIATSEFKKMIRNQWVAERAPRHPPPEARFVTGNPNNDSHMHLLETKYGVRLILSRNGKEIESYEVVDEPKFAWFVLRWA